MRTKFLLVITLCAGMFASAYAQEAVDTTAMGVHPFKATANMVKPITGFSLMFQGGLNVFQGDYPAPRFSNIGYPTAGLSLEYNFTPVWGLGASYLFAMPQVRTTKDEVFLNASGVAASLPKGSLMHKGMMHRGQVYATFNLVNAWFPRNVAQVFGLNVLAGLGVAGYKNSVSYHDSEDSAGDAGKYIEDGPTAQGHDKYESVGYVALGATADFNVSRQISLGLRAQYNLFMDDYVDNRYLSKANKRNDAMVDLDIHLRWKIGGKNKNHVLNVASFDVLDDKYYESHPEAAPAYMAGKVDTVVLVHRDTVVVYHRDTIVMQVADKTDMPMGTTLPAVSQQSASASEKSAESGLSTERFEQLNMAPEKVVVQERTQVVYGQSLSQLARRYYKNTFCWVYIWLANKSVAPDPNLILTNVRLRIPTVTEEQLTITKDEAKALAAHYRD